MSAPPSQPVAPQGLVEMQRQFSRLVSLPLIDLNRAAATLPDGESYRQLASAIIATGGSLEPCERMELYNQQYWWRLVKVLHENYPFLLRLWGRHDFNSIMAQPYLEAYPPSDWSLRELGARLPDWIEAHYHERDRALALNAARLDSAYDRCFHAVERAVPSHGLEATAPLALQTHTFLFQLPYDLFTLRDRFLEETPDYWQNHPFPPAEKGPARFFVLWRTASHDRARTEVDKSEFDALSKLARGISLERLFESADESLAPNVAAWCERWAAYGWLRLFV